MTTFTVLDVIRTKRDGEELSDEQIRWFIAHFTDGTVADEQASALLMAVFLRGLSPRELATWTAAMVASGERLDLSTVGRPTVDKHSTGGVGDKVSLPLCPIVAACGLAVPQVSGRGLGHTGGTLDKMESIAGWSPLVTSERFIEILHDVGAVIAAAGDTLAPADRRMYALRDVTATVEAIPLIASSIMSKKIAEGTDALVLDVKIGSGAFLPSIESARALATAMVELGKAHGVRTSAVLTDMDQPLGLAVGNALEVAESIEILDGGGPRDTVAITLALARRMCELGGSDVDPADVIANGAAMDRWNAMVRAQGGDPCAALPRSDEIETITTTRSGHIARIDARKVGEAAWRLGSGRSRKEDPVSASAGIVLRATAGDKVGPGAPLFDLHIDDPARVGSALEALEGAVTYSDEPVADRRLIHEHID